MKRPRIKAVLFDWDNTLAYTLAQNQSPIERTTLLFQKHGIECTVEQCKQARQTYLRDLAFGKANGSIHPQTKQEIITFYRELMARIGYPNASRDVASRIYMSYGQLPHFLFEDVLPTMTYLAEHGYSIGILSNHSAAIRPVMEKMVGSYIASRHIVISDEEGVHKPSKTIFRKMISRIKEDPESCLYVGDNLYVDAIGAVQNGRFGYGLWLDRRSNGVVVQDLPSNVVRITDLQQVLDFVA